MKTFLTLLAIGAAWAAGYGYGRWYAKGTAAPAESGGRRVLYYIDPMHPAYKSDKPGVAPDCGMKLEPVYADAGPAAPPAAERKVLHYRDPKDHKFTSDKPGLNPETGNDLEPVYAGEPASMPPGTVQISPEKQQLIGVRYGAVELTTGGAQTIRAVGKVSWDETRVARVHSRVEGFIEKVFVDSVGARVERGQTLLALYSPEMLATQQEYLLALRSREVMHHSTIEGMPAYSDSLAQAARRRLELWNLPEEQIEELARRKEPQRTITIHSPIAGYVITRNAFASQKIMPDTELYNIVDLSRVWVIADVFEHDAPLVRLGQNGVVTLAQYPGRRLAGPVSYIQPQVDPVTRTLKVRVELDNPGMMLKPEMFTDVEFRAGTAARLTVAAEAVLDGGRVQRVFVDRGNGYLEPREVQIGQRLDGRIEILKGLKPGERVVTSGNFLVDSESQLKAAAAGMSHPH